MNNKTLSELEQIQNDLVKKWNCKLNNGIKGKYINKEDGLPWLEISGTFTKESAKAFAQEMANNMNVRVLMNRLECWFGSEDNLCLVLDIENEHKYGQPVPAYSTNESKTNHINDYGQEILPNGS